MKSINLQYTYYIDKIFIWSIYYTFYLARLGPLIKQNEIIINTSYNYEGEWLNVFIRLEKESYIDLVVMVDKEVRDFLDTNINRLDKIHKELKKVI